MFLGFFSKALYHLLVSLIPISEVPREKGNVTRKLLLLLAKKEMYKNQPLVLWIHYF